MRGAAGGAVCTGRIGKEVDFLGKSVWVPAVSRCERPRKEAITGYRGFIPGVKAETVWGTNTTKAMGMAHEFRQHDRIPYVEVPWNCPPDAPQCVRSEKDTMHWTSKQALPASPYQKPGPRHADAIVGFSGHECLRNRKSSSLTRAPHVPAHEKEPGSRHCLPVTMDPDRECQPWDQHRVAMPGYSGHVRNRSIA